MLPKSTTAPISYTDAFFIATSAVCVTGLSPLDISTMFTPFGWLILSILIQVGGLGLIAFYQRILYFLLRLGFYLQPTADKRRDLFKIHGCRSADCAVYAWIHLSDRKPWSICNLHVGAFRTFWRPPHDRLIFFRSFIPCPLSAMRDFPLSKMA